MESHLLQMRGLKLWKNRAVFDAKQSHLLQMRGLKHGLHGRAVLADGGRIFYRCVD